MSRGTHFHIFFKGYGFVDFEDEANVDEAIRNLDNYEVNGKRILVEKSKSRPRRGGKLIIHFF